MSLSMRAFLTFAGREDTGGMVYGVASKCFLLVTKKIYSVDARVVALPAKIACEMNETRRVQPAPQPAPVPVIRLTSMMSSISIDPTVEHCSLKTEDAGQSCMLAVKQMLFHSSYQANTKPTTQ